VFRLVIVTSITVRLLLSAPAEQTGTTHTYYISADEVDWNYAPAEIDHMTGKPYDERARLFVVNDTGHIGRIFRKAVYRE